MRKSHIAVTGLLIIALAAAGATTAAAFAPEGARGMLEMEITVEGQGRVDECGFCDHYTWKALHRASLRVPVTAMAPAVDAAAIGAALGGAAGDAADGDDEEGDEDEDWEAEWDDKLDACDGDEDCEVRVTMQKMQDPRFKSTMAAVAKGFSLVKSGQLDLGPALQHWAMLGGDVAGNVSIEQQRNSFGVADTGGGPKVDVECRIRGSETVKARPTGYGDMHPILTINAKQSTYELRLPAEQAIAVTDDCSPDQPQTAELLGFPGPGRNWGEVLQVAGKLSGSADRPSFDGSGVWEGDLSGHSVRVTIQWNFRPGA